MTDQPLRLAPGVHVCRSGPDFVFLDRRQDAYTGIAGPRATALEACLAGAEPSAAVDALFAEGLLARPGEPGRAFEVTAIAPATRDTADLAAPAPGRLDPLALLACLSADRWLRRSFDEACRAAERALVAVVPSDPEVLAAAAADHARARRWYPRGPGCLFDALALLLYLARRGLAADWIFGVRLAPWAAHCWVQAGDCLVGAPLESIARFTPIMRVGASA